MMLVAMFTVHLKYGFSSINTIGLTRDGPQFGPPGYEVNLLYIAGLLSLILGGAGALSLDRLVSRKGGLSSAASCATAGRASWATGAQPAKKRSGRWSTNSCANARDPIE